MAKGVRLKDGMASGDKRSMKTALQNSRITFYFVTFSYCLSYICIVSRTHPERIPNELYQQKWAALSKLTFSKLRM